MADQAGKKISREPPSRKFSNRKFGGARSCDAWGRTWEVRQALSTRLRLWLVRSGALMMMLTREENEEMRPWNFRTG